MGLFSEIRRRNVFRMAALYIVAAWLVMQVAEVLISLISLPAWVGPVVIGLLALGFPLALVLSWFYELTPEGISLDTDGKRDVAATHAAARRMDFIVISLLSAAILLFAWHTWWSPGSTARSTGSAQTIQSVAVLPLQNLSDDPAQKYLVEGMQDALITWLSRMTDLRVISKRSTLSYEATDKSIQEIARELNVDALVEGSVLRDQGRVRITAKLILGAEDEYIWANSYDRDLDQILALTSEISLAIADEIQATVKQQAREDSALQKRIDFALHELVLQGDHYFDRFLFDESLLHYQQAVDKAPDFALAHAGVANSYLGKAFFRLLSISESVALAREAALKAISLDNNSARGYAALGMIQLYFDWDWDLARATLLRAVELAPNNSGIRHAYGDYLLVMGDLEGSLEQVEIGLLYDPLSPMAQFAVRGHKLFTRQYDALIEEGRSALAEDPDSTSALLFFREALWFKGDYGEAFDAYKKTWGRNEALLRALNEGFSESGYMGALRSLADALAERDSAAQEQVTLARLYARAGEPEAALAALERAYQHRQPQILHIKAHPDFDALRSTPEFQDLLRRIGFPETPRK
jgi:TolB-like protein/Tfp pilus assembly protein PilF